MNQILINRILLIFLFIMASSSVYAAEHVTTAPAAINMSDYFKVLFGLVFVIALFLFSTFLYKRFGNASLTGHGQIRIIDGLHLGNRERLVLVELKDKQILLSVTPGQISKLDTINLSSITESTNA